MQGPTNCEILGEKESNFPTSRHLYEMDIDGVISLNLPLFAKGYRQVHRDFECPEASNSGSKCVELSGVYLVARPNRWNRLLTAPLQHCHWSIYSQGHYYHIAKRDTAGFTSITLRDDDYSAPYKLPRFLPKQPFVAYHIGTTDYGPSEIHTLAQWVVADMADNDITTTNHQRFVWELGARIICGARNSTVLMGDLLQIAKQEYIRQFLPGAPIPSEFATGMQLVGSNEPIDTAGKRVRLRNQVESNVRSLALCWEDGRCGNIDEKTHEYHPALRPLVVTNQRTILGLLRKLPSSSNYFPRS